jgi:hypothetical protein
MEEKNPDVVTYCGLCCLDCHGHTGKIADLALGSSQRNSGRQNTKNLQMPFSKIPNGKPFEHYQQCYDLLGAMVKFRCKKGCRDGGGPPFLKNQTVLPGKKDYRVLGMQ